MTREEAGKIREGENEEIAKAGTRLSYRDDNDRLMI